MKSPPGLWRVLAPAGATWALAVISIALPGSWWALVVVGICIGMAAMLIAALTSKQRAAQLLAYAGVLAALLLVTGARIGVAETHRVAPVLDVAIEASDRVELRVQLTDFAQLETGVDPTQLTGWVPATVLEYGGRGDRAGVMAASGTPVVLWLQRATQIRAPDQGEPWRMGPESSTSNPAAISDTAHWAPGTELIVVGEPVPLEPTSSAAYGVRVTGYKTEREARGPALIAATLRFQLRAVAERVPGAELVPGFAVGDTALVGPELEANMQASSLTHLVAVSGANCALVTSAAIWALSWLGAGRRLRAVAAGVTLAGFVVVVGPDASVQRAAIMGAVLLASNFGGNRATALPALGVAIAVLLVLDPWQAWHPGFALSVVATGGIILCAPAFTEALRRALRIPAWVALPFAVAAAAQLACGPLLLLLQDGLPAAGLLANVLAGPAAPAGTALGLLALLAAPVSGAAAHALVWLASLPARWVEETARITAELPGARWEWVTGVPGALLLTVAQALAIAAWLLATGRLTRHEMRVRRPWQPDTPGPRVLRRWVSVLAGCAAGVFIGPTLVAPAVERAATPEDWRVVACDVGQGDALLLRGPDARPGEAILVDTGDDDQLLRDCLGLFGVTRISLLVLTHDHLDHTGALEAVAAITDAAVIGPSSPEGVTEAAVPLEARLRQLGLPTGATGAGATGMHAGVSWALLAPDQALTPATINDSSLVMRAEIGELRVLLLGDTGEKSQVMLRNALLRAGNETLLQSDIVKVAHHGSRDQLDGFYETVGASVGIVSSGEDNSYGHPSVATLTALAKAHTRVLRTDELGSVAITQSVRTGADVHPDPASLRIWASRGRELTRDE